MTFRIDRTQRLVSARRAANDEAGAPEEATAAGVSNLPVPVGPVTRSKADRREGEASFSAQMLGQDGQKRGLRAGEPFIAAAKNAYDTVEWSGTKDRRARKGRKARTEV